MQECSGVCLNTTSLWREIIPHQPCHLAPPSVLYFVSRLFPTGLMQLSFVVLVCLYRVLISWGQGLGLSCSFNSSSPWVISMNIFANQRMSGELTKVNSYYFPIWQRKTRNNKDFGDTQEKNPTMSWRKGPVLLLACVKSEEMPGMLQKMQNHLGKNFCNRENTGAKCLKNKPTRNPFKTKDDWGINLYHGENTRAKCLLKKQTKTI